jgi:hypothetical protein
MAKTKTKKTTAKKKKAAKKVTVLTSEPLRNDSTVNGLILNEIDCMRESVYDTGVYNYHCTNTSTELTNESGIEVFTTENISFSLKDGTNITIRRNY